MNDKELDKSIKKSFENFIKELATNPEKVFDNDKLQIKYNKVLKEKIKLQSNWNSLREWLEERYKITKENSSSLISKYDGSPLTRDFYEAVINIQAERKDILDKMNELEGE